MKSATDPGVGRTGVLVGLTQIVKGKNDAEHEETAVQQSGRASVSHGPEQSGGRRRNGIGRSRTRDSHNHRVEEPEDS